MRILFFFLIVFALQSSAQISGPELTRYYLKAAQPCGGLDSLLSKKGSWKRAENDIISLDAGFPKDQLAQLNARLDKFLPLMKEAVPDLSGMEARWYRTVNGA